MISYSLILVITRDWVIHLSWGGYLDRSFLLCTHAFLRILESVKFNKIIEIPVLVDTTVKPIRLVSSPYNNPALVSFEATCPSPHHSHLTSQEDAIRTSILRPCTFLWTMVVILDGFTVVVCNCPYSSTNVLCPWVPVSGWDYRVYP